MKERRPVTAVIFLTARDMESNQLRGFELGGDCYDDGNLFINFSEMTAALGGAEITFTPMEYRMLKVFTKNVQTVYAGKTAKRVLQCNGKTA